MTTVFLTEQPLLSTECVKQLFNTVLFAALTESSLSTTETKQSKNTVDTRQRQRWSSGQVQLQVLQHYDMDL